MAERTTVTVASKLPYAIVMQCSEPTEKKELVLGGGVQKVMEYDKAGQSFVIQGCAIPRGNDRNPEWDYPQIVGGFALTPGVPADLWVKWCEEHKDTPFIKNGLIFAEDRRDFASAAAKERRELKSGLEPIDPANPPQIQNPYNLRIQQGTTSPE